MYLIRLVKYLTFVFDRKLPNFSASDISNSRMMFYCTVKFLHFYIGTFLNLR